MSGLITGKIIVKGIQYDATPGAWRELHEDGFDVREQSTPVLDGKRVVMVQAPKADGTRPGIETRLVQYQAWEATFDAEAWLPPEMYTHLKILRKAQVPFWLQFDDVMSWDFAPCYSVEETGKYWHTPTYPITPFGNSPVSPRIHDGNLYVDDVVQHSGYTIDDEFGVITFDPPISTTSQVVMRYTWRAYCRIAAFDAAEVDHAPTKTCYVGKVVFEQIAPNYADQSWQVTPTYWSTADKGTTPQPAAPVPGGVLLCTNPTNPTAASSVARSGSTVAWSNPGNALSNDDTYATAALTTSDFTEALALGPIPPPFVIPSSAVLATARLRVDCLVTPATGLSFDVLDDFVYLTLNGTETGANLAKNSAVSTAEGMTFYDIDLTGYGLTVDDFNNSLVGAKIGYKLDNTQYHTGDFAITYEYSGTGKTVKPSGATSAAWGSGGTNTSVTATNTIAVDGAVQAIEQGSITVKATYTGSAPTPKYVFLSIHAHADAGSDNPLQRNATADNGMGDASVMDADSNSATSDGTHTVKVPVMSGVASYTINLKAQASRTFRAADAISSPMASAEVSVTATAVAPSSPTVKVNSADFYLCWTGGALPPGVVNTDPPINADRYVSDLVWSTGWPDGVPPTGWKTGIGDNRGCGCDRTPAPTSTDRWAEGWLLDFGDLTLDAKRLLHDHDEGDMVSYVSVYYP